LPPARVEQLERLLRRVEPVDPVERYAQLFTWHPDGLPIDVESEDYERELNQLRVVAVREIVEQQSVGALLAMAYEVEVPYCLGVAAAEALLGDNAEALAVQFAIANDAPPS